MMYKMNKEWLDNMNKVRDRWNTTYLDMFHWGDNFMPQEMGFIYWQTGNIDYQLPYGNRINNKSEYLLKNADL